MAKEVWSVTDLVDYFTGLLDQDIRLRSLWVEGEISNFTHHHSGHMYFTIKDKRSRMKVVMFSRYNRLLLFQPKDGDQVLIRGELYVYERMGQVQLKAWEMRNSGLGDLYVAYMQLKEQLEQEGLFSIPKKSLPRFPSRVGVITSSRGAAVRDIISTITRRFPEVQIRLYPVSVQGDHAAQEIAAAIQHMNEMEAADVLIVGRGGGSLEELWAFNEEIVVRAIANSMLPVISAVGHETDTTLSDYVADLRAPTPTAAAELAVPDREEWCERLQSLQERMIQHLNHQIRLYRKRLQLNVERPSLLNPTAQFDQYSQRLDYLFRDLQKSMIKKVASERIELEHSIHRLQQLQPAKTLQQWRELLEQKRKALDAHLQSLLMEKRSKHQHLLAQLDALSPLQVMKRGYSLLYRMQTKQLVQSVKEVQAGDLIRVRMKDGELKCQVWRTEERKHE